MMKRTGKVNIIKIKIQAVIVSLAMIVTTSLQALPWYAETNFGFQPFFDDDKYYGSFWSHTPALSLSGGIELGEHLVAGARVERINQIFDPPLVGINLGASSAKGSLLLMSYMGEIGFPFRVAKGLTVSPHFAAGWGDFRARNIGPTTSLDGMVYEAGSNLIIHYLPKVAVGFDLVYVHAVFDDFNRSGILIRFVLGWRSRSPKQ